MTQGQEKPRITLPWMATSQTGWAAKQALRSVGKPCADSGTKLEQRQGCTELRCLTCEPYLSDDWRWGI
jgi:hypothetical protein